MIMFGSTTLQMMGFFPPLSADCQSAPPARREAGVSRRFRPRGWRLTRPTDATCSAAAAAAPHGHHGRGSSGGRSMSYPPALSPVKSTGRSLTMLPLPSDSLTGEKKNKQPLSVHKCNIWPGEQPRLKQKENGNATVDGVNKGVMV